MRRCVTLGLLLLFVGATIALAGEPCTTVETRNNTVLLATGVEPAAKAGHLDEVIFIEDWESGLNGWTSVDLTAVPGSWHIDTWMAYGETGMSWCMGQNPVSCDTVGYINDWYMVLNSPSITLPAGSCSLTFQSRIACEIPEGADPPYNGWDGCNLRISTDDGATWTVITNDYLDPDYDRSSLYSFGFQHGEGANIPGWCGQHFDWFLQTVDLTPWAGQTVRLRWAFASDPAWDTCDGAGQRWAFGWQVDDIRIFSGSNTVFSNDGDDDTDWISGTNRPIGGDLWRVADEVLNPPSTPPSGTHYLACNDAVNYVYNDDMNNELVSPYVDLRDLDFGTVYVDFMITGLLGSNPDNFPDCDFWHWEVTGDSGATWCFASNPTCDPNGFNYVHPDAPELGWYLYSEAYASGFDISYYIGSVVKIKVVMESNSDGLTGVGPCFDDITMTYESGFPNDVSCYTYQICFPTTEGRVGYGTAYFVNAGSQDQTGVAAWWKEEGTSQHRFLPNLDLASGETDTRSMTWTPGAAGLTTVLAWSYLSIDENLENDTSYCRNIDVRGAEEDLELGYDNRTTQWAFNLATGEGAMVRFTPEADSIDLPFNLNMIRAQFDGSQSGTKDVGLRIFLDDEGTPGEAVFRGTIPVTESEVLPNWKEITVDGAPGTHGMTGDFWVWFELLEQTADPYPKIIGDDAEDWENHDHFYVYREGEAPEARPYFYTIRAMVTEGTSDAEPQALTPITYTLSQNYPNPFNPTTEIAYTITRTEKVSLRVFNLLGQEVAVLVDGVRPAGMHKVQFNGSDLASGIYIYRLETPNFTAAHKMVLMK
jgi:hypothetical protein